MKRSSLALAVPLIVAMLASSSTASPLNGAAPADGHVPRAQLSGAAARALGAHGEIRGVALNDGVPGRVLLADIPDFPRMAALGITSVSVYIYLYVPSPTGTTITTGTNTPTDAELQAVAAAAHASHLDLTLTPVLLNSGPHVWRGMYQPSDLAAFFTNYTAQLVKYATLSEQLGATLFYVGSENNGIAGDTAYWRAAIREVRQHYSGAVSYMSTAYESPFVKFWDDLDLASISVYLSMGEDANPTYQRFMSAWHDVHTPFIQRLTKYLHKPLVYAEVGYNSAESSFAHPQYEPGPTAIAAPAAQADAYRAFLDVLHDNPSVYGTTWWHWQTGSTVANTGYSPNGKPAECVIAANWSENAAVRAVASAPVCDLHALDAVLATAGGVLPQ